MQMRLASVHASDSGARPPRRDVPRDRAVAARIGRPAPHRRDDAGRAGDRDHGPERNARALQDCLRADPGRRRDFETVVDTETRDFTLSSLFQVLDPQSFTANLAAEGMTIDPSSWRNVGAEGVVKGQTAMRGNQMHVELRLYVVSRGSDAVLTKEYDVAPGSVRERGAPVR